LDSLSGYESSRRPERVGTPHNASVDLVEQLRAWSYRRQRLDRSAPDALSALRDVVGVYSAHPSGPMALHARSPAATAKAFADLESRKAAIRVVGMRGSAFMVPADSADMVVAATRRSLAPSYLKGRGLEPATYARLKPRILAAIAQPVTPAQLQSALGAAKDDQLPYFAMRVMAREGLVIRIGAGRIRTDDLRWVATEAWLGRPFRDVEASEALGWLVGAYLKAFGPARETDVAWWAGVPQGRAKAAIATHDTVDVGDGFLLMADISHQWEATKAIDSDAVAVLGKWDPYLMGYAPDGRRRFVDDAHRRFAYSTAETRIGATSGDSLPVILRGGRAVAGWSHRLAGDRMEVEIRPFPGARPRGESLSDLTEPAFDAIGKLLDARVFVSQKTR
jgi:Winged helix DNA-binding domain